MSLPAPSEKRAAVEAMFDRISTRYDRMNRWMTFGIDRNWRRRAIDSLALAGGERVLDLACGTADLAREATRRGAIVVGVDRSAGMLRVAARGSGYALVRGDALALPLRGGSCDAVVSGFALRNFTDLAAAFAECARVLRSGGRLALLEVDTPRGALRRAGHRLYFRGVVPLLGRLLADREAYRYLPDSVAYLPDEARLAEMLRAAGFDSSQKVRLLGGAAQLVTAMRAGGGCRG